MGLWSCTYIWQCEYPWDCDPFTALRFNLLLNSSSITLPRLILSPCFSFCARPMQCADPARAAIWPCQNINSCIFCVVYSAVLRFDILCFICSRSQILDHYLITLIGGHRYSENLNISSVAHDYSYLRGKLRPRVFWVVWSQVWCFESHRIPPKRYAAPARDFWLLVEIVDIKHTLQTCWPNFKAQYEIDTPLDQNRQLRDDAITQDV